MLLLLLWCAFYGQVDTVISFNGARIAQLVEHPTSEKGTILAKVSVPPPGVWHGIFLPESASSQTLLRCMHSPLCAVTRINICVHVKNPKPNTGTQTVVWTRENTTRTDRDG